MQATRRGRGTQGRPAAVGLAASHGIPTIALTSTAGRTARLGHFHSTKSTISPTRIMFDDSQRLDALEAWVKAANKNFEVINKDIEAVNKNFENTNKTFEASNKNFESLGKSVDNTNKNFDATNKNFDAIFKRLESLERKVAALEKQKK
jgi:septal ring factor EnvC (AmiA/AmiB activator)